MEVFKNDGIVAGCSAGAMIMGAGNRVSSLESGIWLITGRDHHASL